MALIQCGQNDPRTGRRCELASSEQMLRARGLRCPGCGQPVRAEAVERLGLAGREGEIVKAAEEAAAVRRKRRRP